MKKAFNVLFFSLALLSLLFLLYARHRGKPGGASYAGGQGKASWQDQLKEMGSLLYRTSNINVINGLDLSDEQLKGLRAIAIEVERESPPFTLQGSMAPDLAKVESAYRELQQELLRNRPLPRELIERVAKARSIESKVLRDTLGYDSSRKDCLRCHYDPALAGKGGGVDLYERKCAANPAVRKEQAAAHMSGYLGKKGTFTLWTRKEKVDALLTDNQKVILEDFSCCLIPPQSFADPVRIGQVEVSEWDVKLLDAVRSVSEPQWPPVKEKILGALESQQVLKRPDFSSKEARAFRERAQEVMEKARALSAEDFELKKEELVKAMKPAKKQALSPDKASFMRAFFLVLPGSSRTYDAVLARRSKGGE
ncbi:MAG: hypothetical protein RDV48_19400 [Candidatus Eremiobacteraeota bacterium]|nr:hypothetical protein [Candidatus Eremiobacteraeota bacterium]